MLIGINYPWLNYGWDFGDPPPMWITAADVAAWRAENRSRIAADFVTFAALGLSAVRWFLLADGTSYGYGDDAPHAAGDGRWRAEPLPREHSFHAQLGDDFEFVLRTAAELNLKLLPSLLDFHWCFPGDDSTAGLVKGGRAEIVHDALKRGDFFDRVLEPLLDISLRRRDAIYAWELINEPEWATNDDENRADRIDPHEQRSVPLGAMLNFLAAGLTRINDRRLPSGERAFRSSVGFAQPGTTQAWDAPRLGVTLHQFHYYAQGNLALPPHNSSADFPCIVGEFATAVERDWPDLKSRGRAQTLPNRLAWLAAQGYPAAFLWAVHSRDQATRWTPDEQQQTLAYVRTPARDLA